MSFYGRKFRTNFPVWEGKKAVFVEMVVRTHVLCLVTGLLRSYLFFTAGMKDSDEYWRIRSNCSRLPKRGIEIESSGIDMAGHIPDQVIGQVRSHFDLLDFVQRHVHLKKSGRNYFGLCPFHAEKSPSFSVAPDKQIFYCFGCGIGGDVINFVMNMEQMTFIEAVQHLADQANISLPATEPSLNMYEEDERQQMGQALQLAAQLYHHILLKTPYGEPAFHYLGERQVSLQTMEEFQIGFAPLPKQFLLSFLLRRGYPEKLLEKAGLVVAKEHASPRYVDRFRGRVMFPLHNPQGRVIGFSGRLMGAGQPKYLNSPETPLFHKGHHLFNLHRARKGIRKEQQALLFEGQLDVMTAWQAGIYTGIATLGTALTDNQARIIKRNASTVIICYDADAAGQAAAVRGLDMLKSQECIVKVAQMPVGLDPDDYIKRYGVEAFKEEILAGSLSATAFKLESLKKEFHLQDEDSRLQYVSKSIDFITDLPLAIEQDHYLRRLAEEFQLSLEAVKEEQRKIKYQKKRADKRDKERDKWNNGYREIDKQRFARVHAVPVAEKSEMLLIAYMMRDKSITEWIKNRLGADFHSEVYAALAAYLYAYYEQGYPEDVGRFIGTLPDAPLISKASELAMLELPDELSEEALQDYIWHIRNYPIQKEIEQKERLIEQLARADEPVKAAQLLIEIMRLRRQLQRG
jgi:DNA primase